MSRAELSPQREIESIREENRLFYEDPRGRGALKDLQQTFPNHWIYIAELLQNALDVGASRLLLTTQADGSLLFEHNGKAFNAKNVRELCSRGVSSKGIDTIGFMGVGFKAIFRSFETVTVSSGAWRFRLTVPIRVGELGDRQRDWLGSVLPEWEPELPRPSSEMTSRFMLSSRVPGLPPIESDIDRVFGENDGSLIPLLAWRGVTDLNWSGTHWQLEGLERAIKGSQVTRFALRGMDDREGTLRQWILFQATYTPSTDAIRALLEHRQIQEAVPQEKARSPRKVAVFCELSDEGVPVPVERGKLFAILPTGATCPLGLHLQADWLLAITRRDLMPVEGNAWQQEILGQVPTLMREYLAWLASEPTLERPEWTTGLQALPGSTRTDSEPDRWFTTDQFLAGMRKRLELLAFLPGPVGHDGVPKALSPAEGRLLPRALIQFDDGTEHQRVLFGDRAVSEHLLGSRAATFLDRLDLLLEFAATELEVEWQSGRVAAWQETLDGAERMPKLALLLAALASLDADDEWKAAQLVCLPTQSKGWTDRGHAKRLPPDWNALANEDLLRGALEGFLGTPEELISAELENHISRTQGAAAEFLEDLPRPSLGKIVDALWDSLPRSPNDSQINVVLRLTEWVLFRQPLRKGLIKRLLCRRPGQKAALLPTAEVLVGPPYAGSHRTILFPKIPNTLSDYLEDTPGGSPDEWRAFLEALDPPPIGRFGLVTTVRKLTLSEEREWLGTEPPPRATTWQEKTWRHARVDNEHFWVSNADLPEQLTALLMAESNASLSANEAAVAWLVEGLHQLREHAFRIVAYIPSGKASVTELKLRNPACWVRQLRTARWVYSTQGSGPFAPADILPGPDPLQPDAPVARLPDELVTLLTEAGMGFGENILLAPGIQRLRIQGPHANAALLATLLRAAIDEVTDSTRRDLLTQLVRETALLPVRGARYVDGAIRIPGVRLVQSRGRGTLGDWLLARSDLLEDAEALQVFDLIGSVDPVPAQATGQQALGFLLWVWRTEPSAEAVRGILPLAYKYLRTDILANPQLAEAWDAARPPTCQHP